ncbi:MAG: diguanylate cyclase [Acidobacteriota bacterium]
MPVPARGSAARHGVQHRPHHPDVRVGSSLAEAVPVAPGKARPTATAILRALADVVISADRDGRVTYMNPAAERASGWSLSDLLGGPLQGLLRSDPRRTRRGEDSELNGQPRACQLICRSGALRSIEVSESTLDDERGLNMGRVFVCRDIGPALALSQALQHGALHDALTGLTNRRGLLERLQEGLAIAARRGKPLAVCFLDVDGLKAVNDGAGHSGGDQLLRSIARRLSMSVRASDTVARIGGDEFVVVLPRLEHARDTLAVTHTLTQSLARPHRVAGRTLAATASMGWAYYPNDGCDAQSLLGTADRAMYAAKRQRMSATTALPSFVAGTRGDTL